MKHGFFRVGSASPAVKVADTVHNVSNIIGLMARAADAGVDLTVFPELCVSGYTCGELFHNRTLLDGVETGLKTIAQASAAYPGSAFVVGAPVELDGTLYNCAVVIHDGQIAGYIPKTYLPDYNEFYETRWFRAAPREPRTLNGKPFEAGALFSFKGVTFSAEICEDLWVPMPPSSRTALASAEVIVNLSASNDLIGKYSYLRSLVSGQSARTVSAYAYASAGFGESSTDLVFDSKLIICENGRDLAVSSRWESGNTLMWADVDIEAIRRDRLHLTSFSVCAEREGACGRPVTVLPCSIPEPENWTLERYVDPRPFVPSSGRDLRDRCEEIINIQVAGLAQRLNAIHCSKIVVGISGGLDSTLALLVATRTFDRLQLDRAGIIGVTMPGFGTTGRTHSNSLKLMEYLGVTAMEIPIAEAVTVHFRDINQDPEVTDVTYENSQARERTQILMDLANKENGLVLGTGDLSELALGWATYNGDHMSMYAVNAGVPKTLVRHLVNYYSKECATAEQAAVLDDILDTPISPELIPAAADGSIAQITEDLVGPYELHDFFLYYTLRYGFTPKRIYLLARAAFSESYSAETIKKWMRTFFRRFFNQQFKRSCMPDGPKVGSVCLSPRGDWRMPSDASSALWLSECDNLVD